MDNSIQAHQKELCNKLWAMANALRGNMEAYEFKNYILGMIFYYYLSDKTEKYMVNLLKDDGITYEEAWKDDFLPCTILLLDDFKPFSRDFHIFLFGIYYLVKLR